MKEDVIRVVVKSERPLPKQLENAIRTYGGLIVKFEVGRIEEQSGCGFPFKGFPNKYKRETWAQWEKKCKEQGFNTGNITYRNVVEDKYLLCASRDIRKEQDENAVPKGINGSTVRPNCHDIGLD